MAASMWAAVFSGFGLTAAVFALSVLAVWGTLWARDLYVKLRAAGPQSGAAVPDSTAPTLN